MKDLGESFWYLIVNDFICEVNDDGLDEKGESGFWKKHTIIQNDLYHAILDTHYWLFPAWIGRCPLGTHIQTYTDGFQSFMPDASDDLELIEEDLQHLYRHLGCKISSPSSVQ